MSNAGGAQRPLDVAHWQHRLTDLADHHQVPGAAMAVLRTDGTQDELIEVTHGVLSRATGVPVTPDTAFQIGSITKIWTATVIMQLVDEGRLDLDRPITDVLPDLRLADPETTAAVTMRHLLTHTSGIDGDVFTDTGRGDDCVAAYVRTLAGVIQNHPIGATFSYCNSGFVIAGRVIEAVTGCIWDQAVRERLCLPLGLTGTSTLPEEALLGRVAVGHVGEPGEEPRPTTTWVMPRAVGPAGLVNATARDVVQFARMHLCDGRAPDGTTVLSARSAAAMREKQVDLPDRHTLGDSWGLAWVRFHWDGHTVVGHDGATIGQFAFLRVVPDTGTAVVLLTNGGRALDLYTCLFPEIMDAAAGLRMPPPLTPPRHPPRFEPARYTGDYTRTSASTTVFEGQDGLMMRSTFSGMLAAATGGGSTHTYDLVPMAEDVFAYRPPGMLTWTPVTFYRLPDGTPYMHYGVRANPRRDRTCP